MAKKKKNDVAAVQQDEMSQTEEANKETPTSDESEAAVQEQDDGTPSSDSVDDNKAAEAVVDEDEETIAPETEVGVEDNDAAGEAGDEATPSEEVLALQKELAEVRQEAERNLGNWQRTAAELANFKRRQEEQMKRQRDRIKSEVLEGVISALDDMDLAFQNLPEELDGQLLGWVEGFRLVQRKLDKILDEQNVMLIDTEGQFDPNFHEAISYEDHDEHESDQIIAELRKGYQIGNRVIRPALVRVAR